MALDICQRATKIPRDDMNELLETLLWLAASDLKAMSFKASFVVALS